jgi:hypothetical protein
MAVAQEDRSHPFLHPARRGEMKYEDDPLEKGAACPDAAFGVFVLAASLIGLVLALLW